MPEKRKKKKGDGFIFRFIFQRKHQTLYEQRVGQEGNHDNAQINH
jgi:hypothetical protein